MAHVKFRLYDQTLKTQIDSHKTLERKPMFQIKRPSAFLVGCTFFLLSFASQSLLAEESAFNYGKELYIEKGCFSCHGANGNLPINQSFPRLGGQNQQYLSQEIKAIIAGERKGPLAQLMMRSLPTLSEPEITAISKYLANIKP